MKLANYAPNLANMISNKEKSNCYLAVEIARSSEVSRAQVGCVAVRSGEIVAKATNSYRTRCKSHLLDNHCSCHAEMQVIRQLLKKWCGELSSWQHLIKGAEPSTVS